MALLKVSIGITRDGSVDTQVEVPVEVTEDGMFAAEFDGEQYQANQLDTLKYQLRGAYLAARHEVPFVDSDGERGVMRGYHAGTREMLVTFGDGRKSRMSSHSSVFRPDEITDAEIAEIERLEAAIASANIRLKEIRRNAVAASVIFAEAIGSDVTKLGKDERAALAAEVVTV